MLWKTAKKEIFHDEKSAAKNNSVYKKPGIVNTSSH